MVDNTSNLTINTSSSIWCMLKLNDIFYKDTLLSLVAIGFNDGKVILVDLSRMNVHQEINNEDKVYSLTQFKDDIKYLIFSLANGMIKIYFFKRK